MVNCRGERADAMRGAAAARRAGVIKAACAALHIEGRVSELACRPEAAVPAATSYAENHQAGGIASRERGTAADHQIWAPAVTYSRL